MRTLSVIGALLLAGCAVEADRPGAVQDSAAAGPQRVDGGSSAAPDSAAASAGTADPRVLTEHGLGPLRIGMSADEARAVLGEMELDEPLNGPDPEGCRYAMSDRMPGAWLMFEGMRLVRVDVDSTYATSQDARIGQTEAQVLALYPGARVEPHHYVDGHYLVVIPGAPADTLHRLVFETDGSRVTALRGGEYPSVEYVEGCA